MHVYLYKAVSITICFLLINCFSLYAAPTNIDQVQQAAAAFLVQYRHNMQQALGEEIPYIKSPIKALENDSGQTIAYVAPVSPKGFLILSDDTQLPAVIAYSFRHNWDPDTCQQNGFYHRLKRDILRKKQSIPSLKKAVMHPQWQALLQQQPLSHQVFQQWPEPGLTSSGGWIDTDWHQTYPFNNFCPVDPNTHFRCVVGCAATAMAQIVNYHQAIDVRLVNSDRYTSTLSYYIRIDQDSSRLVFPSFSKTNSYLQNLEHQYKIGNNFLLSDADKAALNFSCAVLLLSQFSSIKTGSYPRYTPQKLKSRMNYVSAEFTDSVPWPDIIDNLKKGLPVEVANEVHYYIFDGYNTNDYVHYNDGQGTNVVGAWQFKDYITVVEAIYNINPYSGPYHKLFSKRKYIHFLPVGTASYSEVEPFQIALIGTQTMTIDSICAPDPFQVSLNQTDFTNAIAGITITPNEEKTLYVRYMPTRIGPVDGFIRMLYQNQQRCTAVYVSGSGTQTIGTVINDSLVSGVWHKSNSPYYIQQNIAVKTNDRLIIEPGVKVLFMDMYRFEIGQNAQLLAIGTVADSIYFDTPNENVGWLGLHFTESADDDTLSYCVLRNAKSTPNLQYDEGGAVECDETSLCITHSLFDKNHANNGGGAICCIHESLCHLSHCVFRNNTSNSGGGIYFSTYPKGELYIENSLFYHNTARLGSCFYLGSGSVFLENVTLCQNSSQYKLGLIFIADWPYSVNLEINNCILWTESSVYNPVFYISDEYFSDKKQIAINYSNIDKRSNNGVIGNAKITWGEGNISQDPLFTDEQNSDFTLNVYSPCIDAGNPDSKYNDPEDSNNPGQALWPSQGMLRNDMGAYGGGMWDVEDTSHFENRIPREFSLNQNYPNPLSKSESFGTISYTTVMFSSPFQSHVNIAVYNIVGQQVDVLLDQQLYPGVHRVRWSAQSVSAGIYFIRMSSSDFVKTIKCVVLK